MSVCFASLSYSQLVALADAVDAGRVGPPFSALSLRHTDVDALRESVAEELQEMAALGMTGRHIARLVRALAAEREARERMADRVELVWTGPELSGSATRDTFVVARELFERAESSVLVSGFAVYQGKAVFAALARRMDEVPALDVRLFLNVARRNDDVRSPETILREFAREFMRDHWPGSRVPPTYFDPRSVEPEPNRRASLHAKCIVVDERFAFVTSANLTAAGQQRNIEAGILVDNPTVARGVSAQFTSLVDCGTLRRIPLAIPNDR